MSNCVQSRGGGGDHAGLARVFMCTYTYIHHLLILGCGKQTDIASEGEGPSLQEVCLGVGVRVYGSESGCTFEIVALIISPNQRVSE